MILLHRPEMLSQNCKILIDNGHQIYVLSVIVAVTKNNKNLSQVTAGKIYISSVNDLPF